MASQGGPIASISIGARTFPVAQDSDPPRDLGGKQNDVDMNGDGETFRPISTVIPGKIGPAALVIDNDAGDQEYIQAHKDNAVPENCQIEYVDGSIYYGQMLVTDATEYSPAKGTMDVTLKGGKLTKQ